MMPGIGWLVLNLVIAPATSWQSKSSEVLKLQPLKLQPIALRRGGSERLLLRIHNVSPAAVVLCIRGSTLRFNDSGAGQGTPHQCQSDANFDLLLAGESHFWQAPIVEGSALADNIAVSLVIVTDSPAGGTQQTVTLRWDGTAQQARRNAAELLSNQPR
jgi:hypothetical protein